MAEAKTTTKPPGARELTTLLGKSYTAFDTLTRRQGAMREWKRRNDTSPWVMKVTRGDRTLFYAMPKAGMFEATVLLGPKATEAALAGRVTKKLHAAIQDARVYAEGRPVRVIVKNSADASGVEQLLAVKLDPTGAASSRRPGRSRCAQDRSRRGTG